MQLKNGAYLTGPLNGAYIVYDASSKPSKAGLRKTMYFWPCCGQETNSELLESTKRWIAVRA